MLCGRLVLESPLFAIDDVSVTGATYTDPARLQKVVDQLDGSTLLGANLGKARQTLAADPWVKRVRVERRPLRGVRIEIVERDPVATYMGADQRWRVLDADGRVMAVLDPAGSKPVDPSELTLAAPGPDLEPGATVPADLAAAASIVPRLPADLRSKTCSVAVGQAGQLTMTMCDGFVIVLGSPDRLRDKLVTTSTSSTPAPTKWPARRPERGRSLASGLDPEVTQGTISPAASTGHDCEPQVEVDVDAGSGGPTAATERITTAQSSPAWR